MIVLDFNGAQNVNYRGPVEVNGIDVPAFRAPGGIAGQEEAIIGRVTSELNSLFAQAGVVFVTEPPQNTGVYSTIFVGGDDSHFLAYGSFIGIAEQVDTRNVNPQDNAFVFSAALTSSDLDTYAGELSTLISHETGHLLGYVHDHPTNAGGPLAEVADTGTTTGSNSTDASYTAANYWAYTPITISGAPSNAVITSATVTWNVDSNYTSDIDWYVENYTFWNSATYTDIVQTGDDWFDGYDETSDGSRTVYPLSSCPVNGTWYFNIKDSCNDSDPNWNKGRIDSWSLTINYSYSSPPGTPGTPDLAAGDDTGYSSSDDITYQTTGLTFSWGQASGTVDRYYYGWDTSTPSSSYTTSTSVDVSAPSGNGNHTFYVRGWNSGSGYGASSSRTVYIDRNRPYVSGLDLRQSDDTGKYYDDNLTNDTNVRFNWAGNSNGGSGIYRYWYGWTSDANDAWTTNNYLDISPPSTNLSYTMYVGAEAVSGLWAYYADYTQHVERRLATF